MNTSKQYISHPYTRDSIVSTLAYFDIFNYPLTKREIWLFLDNHYHNSEFENALQKLIEDGTVYKLNDVYSLQNNYAIATRRSKGYEKAKQLMSVAHKVAALLSKFPYIRGVAISGSLSKNYADDKSDIDFFIITAKNRLWIARTFMYFLVKLAILFKKQHYFCINYFIDEAQLEIEEKNIYTATEIVTLIPLRGIKIFEDFFTANKWTKDFLPNNYLRIASAKKSKYSLFRLVVENVFNNKLGNSLDSFLMRLTSNRWNKKTQQQKVTGSGLLFIMKTGKHYAKHDPSTLQDKVVALHKNKILMLADRNKVKKMSAL